MTASLRLLLGLLVLAVGLIGVGSIQPEWLQALHLPVRESSSMLISLPGEQVELANRRIRAKTQLINKLMARELTLFETAAWFRYMNSQGEQDANAYIQQCFPGRDLNEKVCRQVIKWTEGHLCSLHAPSEVQQVVDRLEQELEWHLMVHGRVVLPGFEEDEE